MKDWGTARIAAASGARLLADAPDGGPSRVIIDSRDAEPGDLFVGLRGEHDDGGRFAQRALEAGAWGVLVGPHYGYRVTGGAVLEAQDPLAALQSLAHAWRLELAAKVIAVTGSAGKTSTKDILAALLASQRTTVASPRNYNTEIGVPLAVLGAPAGTEVLVLELGMRGAGQIAELAAICEPDVGVIVSIGAAHLEQLGSVEAIAAAKAELLRALPEQGTAVIPAGETLLDPYLPEQTAVVRFGPGGDVSVTSVADDGVEIDAFGERSWIEPGFRQSHLLLDLCAAIAAARALGAVVPERLEVEFSGLRGERIELAGGVTIINDCYNANPMSMRAALEALRSDSAAVRRLAVLGDMLELGGDAAAYHRELGDQATDARVQILVTVGELARVAGETFVGGEHFHVADAAEAAGVLAPLLQRDDVVLVKASRGVGLEAVARRLTLMRAGT
ncbi:MAG: UDP-N-acetylmuramoyl-tripeptide--D-alanyl-D-alanine ligase [Solirubrobacteraceae bacterium]